MPRLRMFAGPNGSGKSTLYHQLIKEEKFHSIPYINADEIEITLNSSRPYVIDSLDRGAFKRRLSSSPFIPGRVAVSEVENIAINPGLSISLIENASCTTYLAAAIADAARASLLASKRSFAFETVMSHPSKIELFSKAKKLGYKTYLYFITTNNPLLNWDRIQQRIAEQGHAVPKTKSFQRYKRSMELLPTVLPLCHRAYLFDNSGESARLVASVVDGQTLRLESEIIPQWLAEALRSMGLVL